MKTRGCNFSIRRTFIKALSIFLIFFFCNVNAGSLTVDRLQILELLTAERFDTLDVRLNQLQQDYAKDPVAAERPFVDAFDSFSNSDPSLENKLVKWIAASPGSYAAYLARGIYYINLGFLSRGAKFRNETDASQFDKMEAYFDLATADLKRALTLNPQSTVTYRQLMRISMNIGGKESTAELFAKALKVAPASFEIWNGYLFTLQPKWGGSMQELGTAIRQMEREYAKNSRLKALAGYMPSTYADEAERENKNALALDYYNKAVGFGDHFRLDRGRLHYDMDNFNAALVDFEAILQISPHNPNALRWRGKVRAMREESALAMQDYDLALKLDRMDPDILRDRGELLEDLGKNEQALQDYNDALVYGHNKVSNWYNRGALYLYKFKDYKKAVTDLEKAVKMSPEDPYYWYPYGLAHYYLRDCKIMDSLGTYVKLCEKKKCRSDRVEWSKNSLQHLQKKGTCN